MGVVRLLGWVVLVAVGSCAGSAQSKPADNEAWVSFYAEQTQIRQRGTEALERERSRTKVELCKKAESQGGHAIAECLKVESGTSEQDYVIYAKAISDLLRLQTPGVSDRSVADGDAFDMAEVTWQKYRDQSCESVSRQWIDVQSSISFYDCQLKLTWNHMNELALLYSDLWH